MIYRTMFTLRSRAARAASLRFGVGETATGLSRELHADGRPVEHIYRLGLAHFDRIFAMELDRLRDQKLSEAEHDA
jgi:hypothetical protein